MADKRWVQHISGQGEKWEVREGASQADYWLALLPNGSRYDLPKSEYRLCDPPEVWRDVTEECVISPLAGSELSRSGMKFCLPMGYRFRKVQVDELIKDSFSGQKWVFIVEKKESNGGTHG